MLKKKLLFCCFFVRLTGTDTNVSFDSSRIEREAPKIEFSLSCVYQNDD
ncbi:hypothetical protein ACISNZ_07455 [Campylobacter jejuni]